MPDFAQDLDEVITRAAKAGIGAIVTVGIDPESSRKAVALAEKYPQVFATVGLHPHDASKMTTTDLAELEQLCQHARVVAIGEIGLDFYRNLSPKDVQLEAFRQQLQLAEHNDLPVVVHSRDAHEQMAEALLPWADRQRKIGRKIQHLGVLHCFSGDTDEALSYYQSGFLISIAGTITYPKTDLLADAVRALPLEALLVETDCPFLTPHPHRGRRNEPLHVTLTKDKIAGIRNVPPEVIEKATTENTIRLFALGIA